MAALKKARRRSIRLKHFSYSEDGAYFFTICVYGRQCLLGDIVSERMIVNELGSIVQEVWQELNQYYSNITLDEFVIMPNHVHGIINIRRGAAGERP